MSNASKTVLNDVTAKIYSGLQHPVFTISLETLVVPQTPNGWKINEWKKMWKNAVMVPCMRCCPAFALPTEKSHKKFQ